MKTKKYRIYMEELEGLDGGWCCGHAERCNAPFHRTEHKEEADVYLEDFSAVQVAAGYKRLGYPCKVVPRVSAKRRLEILENGF
jgi:hypothetical protein